MILCTPCGCRYPWRLVGNAFSKTGVIGSYKVSGAGPVDKIQVI